MRVKLQNVRVAFAHGLFKAQAPAQGGDPAFSASFLFEKGSEAHKQMSAAIETVAKEKWAAKAQAVLQQLKAQDKICLHDGDVKSDYVGFEGNMYVSARSKTAPKVLGRSREPITAESGIVYSGCYGTVLVDVYAQDRNDYGKRVNASLVGFQFVKDGDSFGGAAPARDDEFDDLSDTGDADTDGLL